MRGDPLDYEADPRPKLRPDPTTPISDEALAEIRSRTGWPTGAANNIYVMIRKWERDALLARLDAAEADRAALASPEGVVTLNGERFTVEATGESETLNLGSHGEQIGHWYPVKSPLYRLVPYQPEDTQGGDNE